MSRKRETTTVTQDYEQAAREIPLAEAPRLANDIMNNAIQGRTLVKIR